MSIKYEHIHHPYFPRKTRRSNGAQVIMIPITNSVFEMLRANMLSHVFWTSRSQKKGEFCLKMEHG